MAAFPEQDRRAGLSRTRQRGKFVTAYNRDIAFEMIERIANGETLEALCQQEGYPVKNTFHRWLTQEPEMFAQYRRAREVRAAGFEDEVIAKARELVGARVDKEDVNGVDKGIGHLKWAAKVGNPSQYSDKPDHTQAVQVNISMPFNLEAGAAAEVVEQQNLYTATIPKPEEKE